MNNDFNIGDILMFDNGYIRLVACVNKYRNDLSLLQDECAFGSIILESNNATWKVGEYQSFRYAPNDRWSIIKRNIWLELEKRLAL